jgi:hypothetical protein
LRRPKREGNGAIPSEKRSAWQNLAAAAGRPDAVSAALQRQGMDVGGGGGQHSWSESDGICGGGRRHNKDFTAVALIWEGAG